MVTVHTFQILAKQNKFQVKIVIATAGIVGLANWIIDDTPALSCTLFTPYPIMDLARAYL